MNFLEFIGLKTPSLTASNLWLGVPESLIQYAELAEKYTSKEFASLELPGSRLHVLKNLSSAFFGDDQGGEDVGSPDFRPGLLLLNRMGDTAILSVSGPLVNAHSAWHAMAPGQVTSYDAIRDAVAIVKENKDIKKVLLSVSSPGGMALGVDSAGAAIRGLGRTKKVVGHTDSLAASAGYWLLSSAGKVHASRMAELGSIGVIAVYPDFSKAAAEAGIQFHVFSAGKCKAYGFPGTEFTDDEKAYIQSRIEKTNNFFLSTVAKNRSLKLSQKDQWAEAQIFFSGEAKNVGLVDEVSDLEGTLGGLNPAVNSSGGKSMSISEEKLAKISAGESPETVLTPDELTAFYESEASEIEAEDEVVEGTPEAEDLVESQATNSVHSGDPEAMLKLGRAEAKIEGLEDKLQALNEEKTNLKEQVVALKKVAQAAVSNLQVALREPRETFEATADILEQYDSLREKLSTRMPTGRSSQSKTDTQEPDMRSHAVSTPHPIRPY